jgi:hypothetical protein
MQYEKKFFATGSGNFDDADFALELSQWTNMENCRVGSTDFPTGAVGYVEGVGSTELIASALPSSQNYCIGAAYDQPNGRIVFMNWNSGGFHQVRVYDIVDQAVYVALYNSQVEEGLNFDKSKILDVRIINGIVYFTDDINEPRRFNISAAVNMNYPGTYADVDPYSSPLRAQEITVIRRPPYYAFTISKETDVGYSNNFIKNEAFQFAARYRYREFEYSVIGEWSELSPFNEEDETENYVSITMPLAETIDNDVIEVELIVKTLISNKSFVVHTWKSADIQAHNTGTELTFDFYNDRVGIAVDDATANKPLDRVPLLAKTNESGRNRLMFGNVLLGYDTPETTSLEIEVASGEDGDYPGVWGLFTMLFYENESGSPIDTYSNYAVFIPSLGVYYYWDEVFPGPLPSTMDAGDAEVVDAPNISYIGDYIVNQGYIISDYDYYTESFDPNGFAPGFLPATLTVENVEIPLPEGRRSFKSEGAYGAGIVFFDRYRRKCGVVTSEDLVIEMPVRTYDDAVFNTGIAWSLSNSNALIEIPDWAEYYAPLRTRNLQMTAFFQGRATSMFYVVRDDDGNFDYSATTWNTDKYAIGVDISSIVNFGFGYVFTEGDIMKIFWENNPPADTEVSIIGQDGKHLLVQARDFGTLGATAKPLIEVYTPYKASVSEGYYEVGQVYPITDPGEATRAYSTTGGLFNGDVYILTRGETGSEYFTENMSPNDKLWTSWFTDVGWINLIDNIGQVRLKDSILYSNTLVEGTRINGLSTFDATGQADIPLECGPIQKLQITSKVNNEAGAVMLAICTRETASIYLGEVQLVASAANAFVAQSAGVIGTINILKGSFGTANAESVVHYRGNVYWFDRDNGRYVQYGLNGLFPVSNYKATKFWKLFAEQYASMTESEIEALGSRPFVFSGIDPRNNELLVSVPKLADTPPRGYMPDYPSMIYPFDLLDFQAKSVVFKMEVEPNWWQGAYNIPAEMYIDAADELYAFKDGSLYQLNSETSFGNFFGVQYKPRIMFVSNQTPNRPKAYNSISVESNMVPTFVYLYNQQPYAQASDLMDFDFEVREGTYYAPIYRNKIVPTATGMLTSGLLTAEKMRSIALRVLLEFTSTTIPLQLRFVTLGYTLSIGHTT